MSRVLAVVAAIIVTTGVGAELDLSTVKEGNTIRTPGGLKLRIIKYIDKGKRGFVYMAEDKAGHAYAVKIARVMDEDTLESIQNEPKKMKDIKKLGLKYAGIIEAGDNYLVKEFAKGQRADDWYVDWVQRGANKHDDGFKALLALYQKAAAQGAFVQDLNHKNLFWHRGEWTIIDSASTQFGLKPSKALKKFYRHMYETFSKDASCPRLLKLLGLS